MPLIREGVVDFVRILSTVDGLKKAMGISDDIDVTSPQFDIEIYEVKQAISMAKAKHPEDY